LFDLFSNTETIRPERSQQAFEIWLTGYGEALEPKKLTFGAAACSHLYLYVR
jgi:hypothetical protein